MSTTTQGSALEKSMGTVGVTFYGIGTILGAGIFVVIGEVVAKAGALSPLAYLLAATIAVTSALSFSEIAVRIPSAGGAIDYTEAAFQRGWLSALVGWTLVVANIVSGATITTGFVSYLNAFFDVSQWVSTIGVVVLLTLVAAIGMKQSAWFMSATTLVGLCALVLIVWINRDGLLASPGAMMAQFGGGDGDVAPATGDTGMAAGLFAAAFLAIYSFIGFGDVAQTAEEVRDVRHTLPRAMVIVLIVVCLCYVVVAMAITGSGDTEEVAEAAAPLVAAVERHSWPGLPFGIASLFVIVNGGLTQIIAASRLLLDLARDGYPAPAIFGRVNGRTGTPLVATLASSAVVLGLALFVPLGTLAQATSLAILMVFFAVNAALWKLKRRSQPENVPDVWIGWPVLGAVLCGGAVGGQIWQWLSSG
ncbi:putative amino acid permease YhdG [Jannaschia seosinensis]|uniref:Putative amino acid permease YhdG n=1 Tax=Jannaschia seosinensis TaxID=313367 RepID=A0A0M7B5I6_9RHOB|nr:APC family permease [Jannaschia seosinensis]CUH14863.1 putative amino acid permease YhdG [Jannaschia seosinensis]